MKRAMFHVFRRRLSFVIKMIVAGEAIVYPIIYNNEVRGNCRNVKIAVYEL